MIVVADLAAQLYDRRRDGKIAIRREREREGERAEVMGSRKEGAWIHERS